MEISHPLEEIVTSFITSPPKKRGLLSRYWRDGRRDRALTCEDGEGGRLTELLTCRIDTTVHWQWYLLSLSFKSIFFVLLQMCCLSIVIHVTMYTHRQTST